MKEGWIRMLVALFPRDWRARYGEEFALFLREQPLTLYALYDVMASAARERVRAMMSPRLTPRAETALRLAAEEMAGGMERGPSLCLGLLREGQGFGALSLREAGLNADRLRAAMESSTPADPGPADAAGSAWWRAQVVAWATAEALALGQRFVGTEHVLLGLLRHEPRAEDLLRSVGASGADLRARVLDRIAALRGHGHARIKKCIVLLALIALALALSFRALAA